MTDPMPPGDLDDLLDAAQALLDRAHAPYSGFPVGAVVRTHDGATFRGVNVENAAYGSTICAERGAITAMVAAGDQSGIAVVAIAGRGGEPLSPCGACRQVIAEFATLDTVVAGRGDHGPSATWTAAELLPAAFGPLRLAAGVPPATSDADPRPGTTPGGQHG